MTRFELQREALRIGAIASAGLLTLGLLTLLACGDSGGEEESGNAGSGGAATGSAAGSGDDDACNAVSNTAPIIDETAVAEDPPGDPVGGTIAEGTYHLTSHVTYVGAGGMAGPLGRTRKQTLVVTRMGAGAYEAQSVFSEDGEADEHLTFVFTPQSADGTMVEVELSCPVSMPFGITGYTATSTTFVMHNAAEGKLQTYTLQ